MRKLIVISDSFKGTLSSREICGIARESCRKLLPAWETVFLPVADGGEGTVDCFQEAIGGERVTVTVQGPCGEPVQAAYLQLEGGRAVIEMASAAGLPLVGDSKNPCKTTTYGVGQQIRHAVERGNREILLGLGGSCTNDGGCGCAAALGAKFLDAAGREFVPVGGTLDQIAGIDVRELEQLLQNVRLTAMCDVDNPLWGPAGAAYVFGPQKGAGPDMVEFLDHQLRALDQVLQAQLGCRVAQIPGAGAAGGLGAGMMAFLRADLRPGIEAVLDLVGFDGMLQDCSLVVTGEGFLDSQSIRGKVISGVGRRAYRQGVPVVALVGGVAPELESICETPELGIRAVFSINRQAMAFSESKEHSHDNYRFAFESILRLLDIAAGIA